jgi:lipid A ethanolaminephosphotransferase
MSAYGLVIDPPMLVNVAQTDAHEARALLSPWLLLTVAGLGGAPALLVWRTPVLPATGWIQAGRNLAGALVALLLAALIVMAMFQPLASAMRNHKHLRYLVNPFNSLWAVGSVATEPFRRHAGPLQPLGLDARASDKAGRPPLLLLVLGETARSGNFGINGYERPTTPRLAQLEGMVSFTRAWSCGTSTAASLPCMFSHLGRRGFSARTADHENLLDVVQRAGLAVLWIDNQAGCKGVCDRVPNVDVSQSRHPVHCRDGTDCLDGILLEGLEQRIDALPPERRARGVVVVLHTMGSHGPAYAQRSPPHAKRFLPECTSVNLHDCPAQGLRNAYDNSIVYTDQVLGDAIDWLKTTQERFNPALLYLSDHGESLGENNLYLHGLPYAIAPDVQKHVPWVSWMSPGFLTARGLRLDCLKALADKPVSHDDLFSSVLWLVQVRTQAYQTDRDVYARCAPEHRS